MIKTNFIHSPDPDPHMVRRKEMLRKHPELKSLNGKDRSTFVWISIVVLFQVSISWVVSDLSWWIVVLAAWAVGAFASHASFALVHDAVHGLIFKGHFLNRLTAVFSNFASGTPSAISFQAYHLKHHANQGVEELDADLPRWWEIWLFNHGFLGKALWLMLYSAIIAIRPFWLGTIKTPTMWGILNTVVVFSFDALLIYFFGVKSVAYILLSTFFGLGLHPVGARWIQEHFVMFQQQETYSYYGPLNLLSFNVGYHNEHHDFPGVPWSRLPEIRKMAPEYYDTLHYHMSWPKLMWRFLTDDAITLESRIDRETRFGLKSNVPQGTAA
jgi:sphingolipid delta-4 desaturase